jgi:penicillin-binding protein 2
MDIRTGELFALTSYPEYDQSILSDGKDIATIRSYLTGSERPFLNRMTEGLYTPGSIVKPFLGLAALQENIISPTKVIHTTGELRIPNPYNPGQFSIFKDNDDHGDVDMRKAIAVSSNVYFYQICGGFGEQKGLGIANIEKYSELFGIGEKTGINISGELAGTVPSIAWKAKNFKGDRWRLGDTYHTAIGQYGFQVTPIQMLRAVAGIASRGTLVTPTILKNATNAPVASTKLPFTETQYNVIHDAMYMTVTEGSAGRLNMPNLSVGAKTGTAQIKGNTRVNSWVIGFFPVEQPRFAFTVLMEDGPKISGGAWRAFRPVLELFVERPELLTQ